MPALDERRGLVFALVIVDQLEVRVQRLILVAAAAKEKSRGLDAYEDSQDLSAVQLENRPVTAYGYEDSSQNENGLEDINVTPDKTFKNLGSAGGQNFRRSTNVIFERPLMAPTFSNS